ncbi:MAG: branched-chain amino acid ABC transporter permease [Planctomycetota bacterium]|nr:branched-chain amino acid ABC transporter permease [Planctomycetota bacterium]
MTKLLQTLMDGLSVGSLYALIALGYTMVYGVLQFINFAHGDIVMIGAWLSFWICARLGWAGNDAPPSLARAAATLLFAMVVCGTLGFLIERLAYRPLRSAPRLNILITAIGMSLLLENVGQLPIVFGTENQGMPGLLPKETLLSVAGVNITLIDVLIIGCSIALMAGLNHLVYSTRLGLAMRAASFDTKTASLMGVNINRTISLAFVIGAMLAAAAGFLYAVKYTNLNQPAFPTWILLGLTAFVAAVVGGIGNIRGAMIGGVLIGLLEKFGTAYVSSSFKEVYVFSILILVLLFKPTGILGSARVEKV